MNRTLRVYLAMSSVLAVSLSACSGSHSAGSGSSAAGKHTITVGFSAYDMQYDYFKKMAAGTQAAAEKAGYRFVLHDEKSDETTMVNGAEALLDQGVDVLIISPFKPDALGPVVTKARALGVPVIVDDIGGGGTKYDSIVISDNAAGGATAAKYMAAQIAANGNRSKQVVSITCEPTALYAARRNEGFDAAMRAAGFNVVAEASGNSKTKDAQAVMTAALAKHPHVAGVFACNDPMAAGAVAAVVAAGLDPVHDVVTIGFNGDPDAITGITSGKLSATVAQDPSAMGALTVKLATEALKGQTPDWNNAEDREVYAPVTLVTKGNAAKFSS